ncbi:hypothetical protein GJ496_000436 [Pomphorhynchus laevis]|nr:hypothetical protein GJ496_000436 [Pomphorhynchus laevis]
MEKFIPLFLKGPVYVVFWNPPKNIKDDYTDLNNTLIQVYPCLELLRNCAYELIGLDKLDEFAANTDWLIYYSRNIATIR